jgi:hypothetical protein
VLLSGYCSRLSSNVSIAEVGHGIPELAIEYKSAVAVDEYCRAINEDDQCNTNAEHDHCNGSLVVNNIVV